MATTPGAGDTRSGPTSRTADSLQVAPGRWPPARERGACVGPASVIWFALAVGFAALAIAAYYERSRMVRVEYPPEGTPRVAPAGPVEETMQTTLLLVTAGFLLVALMALLLALA